MYAYIELGLPVAAIGLAFGLGRYENFVGPELARLLASARRTLGGAFRQVVMIPGGRVFFLASDESLTADIAGRMESIGIHPRLGQLHDQNGHPLGRHRGVHHGGRIPIAVLAERPQRNQRNRLDPEPVVWMGAAHNLVDRHPGPAPRPSARRLDHPPVRARIGRNDRSKVGGRQLGIATLVERDLLFQDVDRGGRNP